MKSPIGNWQLVDARTNKTVYSDIAGWPFGAYGPFKQDILSNKAEQLRFRIVNKKDIFLPSYEWYNDSIAAWANENKLELISYTPGTLSHADYTTINDKNYRTSETMYNSIINYEKTKPSGLNGFLLLMHIGTGPDRQIL